MQTLSEQPKPLLFDCFTFFNELDILELRLSELNDVVKTFVIAEGTQTFRGDKKPLFFEKNALLFQKYLPKIRHVVIDDFPRNVCSAWDREHWSRRALLRGLGEAVSQDYVMVSDVDEIPRPERLKYWLTGDRLDRALLIMESEAFVYNLNVRPVGRRLSTIQAPRILKRKFLNDPQHVRGFRAKVSKRRPRSFVDDLIIQARAIAKFGTPLRLIVDREAAWHFSFVSSPELMRLKLLSYSHEEYCNPQMIDVQNIARRVESGQWLLDDSTRLEAIPICARFPSTIRGNLDRWAPLLRSVEAHARIPA
jgi:beta-1,4-mannosyl-glycoprotein beta-1,4-N-acetylglucosaminyltransferase